MPHEHPEPVEDLAAHLIAEHFAKANVAELAGEQGMIDWHSEIHARPAGTVTIHIEDCPTGAVMDALIAIERSREQGVFDDEQIRRLTPLVNGLRSVAS